MPPAYFDLCLTPPPQSLHSPCSQPLFPRAHKHRASVPVFLLWATHVLCDAGVAVRLLARQPSAVLPSVLLCWW